jgi:hypothetical protein
MNHSGEGSTDMHLEGVVNSDCHPSATSRSVCRRLVDSGNVVVNCVVTVDRSTRTIWHKRYALVQASWGCSRAENALLRFLFKVLFVALFLQRLTSFFDIVLVR